MLYPLLIIEMAVVSESALAFLQEVILAGIPWELLLAEELNLLIEVC